MAVTYNGVAMTPVGTQANATTAYHVQQYYMVNPPTGAYNIVATPSVSASIYGGASSFTGVVQSAPTVTTSTTGSGFGSVGGSLSTTVDQSMVFDTMGLADATSTLTVGSGQTQDFNQTNTTINRSTSGSHTANLSIGSRTMAWTISGSTARSWGQVLTAIAPPASAVNAGQFFAFF
jgi:hypothetical protein